MASRISSGVPTSSCSSGTPNSRRTASGAMIAIPRWAASSNSSTVSTSQTCSPSTVTSQIIAVPSCGWIGDAITHQRRGDEQTAAPWPSRACRRWSLAGRGRSLRGSIEFTRRQGGEYRIGFVIQRQTDDGLRGGDLKRSGKAAETEQKRHIVRIMPVGQQGLVDAGQHLPSRVPGSKGDQGRRGGRVGIGHTGPKPAFSLFGKGHKPGCRNCRRTDCGFSRGHSFAVALTIQKAGLQRPGAGGPRPAGRKRSAPLHVGFLVNGPPWRQNVGPVDNRSQSRKRDHQGTAVIGKELCCAAHLLRGVVDIGYGGLPTRSHGKMWEVIGSRSLRGSIQFPRRQGGEYGSGFEVQRQADDRLRGGDLKRSSKAGEIEQGRHIVCIMPVGQ